MWRSTDASIKNSFRNLSYNIMISTAWNEVEGGHTMKMKSKAEKYLPLFLVLVDILFSR